MKKRVLASAAFLLGGLATSGCVSDRPYEWPEGDPPPISRMQKSEKASVNPAPETSPLDVQVVGSLEAAKSRKVAGIRVLVNNKPILDDEVRQACSQQLRTAQSPAEQAEILKKTLSYLVDQELLLQDAMARLNASGKKYLDKVKEAARKEFDRQVRENMRKTGITSEADFKKILEAQGVTLEAMHAQVERSFIATQYLQSRIMPSIDHQVGHPQILEYYKTHPEEFKVADSVQWQDIFIEAGKHPSREEAKVFAQTIADRLRQGQDFSELSKYDDGDSVYRKGAGFGGKRDEIQPREAVEVLFRLKDGEVGALVEVESGYHIVRMVKRVHAGQMPFDDKTQTLIRDKLRTEIFNRESKRMINDLKRKAQIAYSSNAP